jgi:hypothetical protein
MVFEGISLSQADSLSGRCLPHTPEGGGRIVFGGYFCRWTTGGFQLPLRAASFGQ